MPRATAEVALDIARATVFRELRTELVAQATLETVAYVLLRVDVGLRDAARARLAVLRPCRAEAGALCPNRKRKEKRRPGMSRPALEGCGLAPEA